MEKPIVIVCTTAYRPFIGGAEIAVEETARRLARDFDFYIVTARMSRALARREQAPEGVIVRLGFGFSWDKWILPFAAAWRVPRLAARQRRSALLWGMDISQGSLAASAASMRMPKIPFVLTAQYGEARECLASGRGGMVRRALSLMLLRVDALTVISRYLREVVREYWPGGETEVIPNGVDIARFSGTEKKTHGHRVVTVSRLVPKNGVDILIRAIAEVKKEIPDVQCLVIGDGPERPRLENLTALLGLAGTVAFAGSVPHDEVPKFLARSDVFVRMSRSEGMGNAFVEALAAGIPVIGTPVGGIPDIIEDGLTGLFAAPEDPADCAAKIIRLLGHPDEAGAIAARGRKIIAARFNWDLIAQSYKDLFLRQLAMRKRITVAAPLLPPDIGGPATYVSLLRDALPARRLGVRVSYFGAVKHLPRIMRHTAYFFRTAVAARGSDAVFAQDPVSTGLPAWLAAVATQSHFALKIVGDYAWERCQARRPEGSGFETLEEFQTRRHGLLSWVLRAIQRFVARRAGGIIVPSKYLKGIVRGWGVKPEKITVIYNAVDLPPAPPARQETRRDLRLSGVVAISAGRLVPWKGFSTLIDAVADLSRELPDLRLFIAGSGSEERALREKIKQKGVEDRVRVMGAIPHAELMAYFAAADVFVLNSGYEGLSHTLLEAAAMGLPVIASRVGGNPEAIEAIGSGTLVAYNDREEIKRAIRETVRKGTKTPGARAAPLPAKERMISETVDFFEREHL